MPRLLSTLVLSSLFVAAPLSGEITAPLRGEIRVTGQVRTTGGTPLADARVELLPAMSGFESGLLILDGRLEPAPAASARADAEGHFELAAPESGVFKVVVGAPGYVPVQLVHTAVVEPLVLAPATLTADRGTRVRVIDGDGRPQAGLWVWAEAANSRTRSRREVWLPHFRAGRTGPEGEIVLPRAAGERLVIQVLEGGAVLAKETSGEDEETIRVRPLQGAGRSPAAAWRSLQAGGPEGSGPLLVRAGPLAWPVGLLEDRQSLHFAGPAGAPLTLWLVKADGRRQGLEMPAPGGGDAPFAVTPPPSTLFAGRLLDEATGRPLAGAVVWLGADPGTFVHSDAEGRYRLAAPADGRFWLQAEAAGYRPRAAWISPEQAGAGKAPTLGLRAAAGIRGRVLGAEDAPLESAQVAAIPRRRAMNTRGAFSPDPAHGRTLSSAGGSFDLAGLEPGLDYDLQVSSPGYATVRLQLTAPESAMIRQKPELVVRLARGRAAFGRVIDDDERPVAGAEVILTAAGERPPARGAGGEDSEHRAMSDAGGRFTIPRVPAAEIDITVFAEGYAPLSVPGVEVLADAGSDGPVDVGTVVLAFAAELSGRVVDPEGEGIADVPIFVVPPRADPEALANAAGQLLAHRSPDARTDAGGGFRLANLAPGERMHLIAGGVERAGTVVKYLEVPLPEPLRIVLEPGLGITGRVLDDAGRPVADAELDLTWAEQLKGLDVAAHRPGSKSRRSDLEGRFAFRGLRPGTATLTAWARGFQPSEPRAFELPLEEETAEIEVVLEPGATLQGEVKTAGGKMLDGVRVIAGRPAAFSDAEGRFRLDGVTPGAVTVEAFHPHYGALVEEVEVEMGEQTLDLTFPDGREVRGLMVDESGRPLPEAALELSAEGRRGAPLYRTRSAADGSFRLAPVADGEYQVQAVLPGSVLKGPRLLRVAGEDLDEVRIVLERGARITGDVLGLDFDQLARLELSAEDGRDGSIRGQVDYSGSYQIPDVPPGQWLVRAVLAGGRRQVQERLEVPAGGAEIHRDLSFDERFVLSGSVLLDGDPLPAALVSLTGRDLAVEREVSTDHLGRFRIEDLEAATYNLGVAHSRELVVHNRDVELDGDRDLMIELQPARVGGWVVDAEDGRSLADALVTLVRLSETGEETNALSVTSGSDGAFDFPRAPPGGYRLSVLRDGYAAATWPLDLAAGVERRDLELELEATRGAELSVVLASGGVPRSVTLVILDAADHPFLRQSRPVADDGRVELPAIPAGVFRVLAQSPGTVLADAMLEVPGEPLTLVLEPAGQLDVRVPALAASDAVATLELSGPNQQPWMGLDPYGQPVAAWRLIGGRATLEGVPAGLWSLSVTAADGQTWHGSAAAVPGARSAVELR